MEQHIQSELHAQTHIIDIIDVAYLVRNDIFAEILSSSCVEGGKLVGSITLVLSIVIIILIVMKTRESQCYLFDLNTV